MIDALSILKDRAENEEAQSLFTLCNDLSKVRSLRPKYPYPSILYYEYI